jgi:hypothetical protein
MVFIRDNSCNNNENIGYAKRKLSIKSKCLTTLHELGYYPVLSKAEQVLYNSHINSLELLGKSPFKALLNFMYSYYSRPTKKELLTNYKHLEESLYNALGSSAAETILNLVRKEVHQQVKYISYNPSLSIQYILKQINEKGIFEFINKMPSHSHVVFLYMRNKLKNKVLSEFFNYNTIRAKGFISLRPLSSSLDENKLDCVNNLPYEEFLNVNKSEAMKKRLDWIHGLHRSSNGISEISDHLSSGREGGEGEERSSSSSSSSSLDQDYYITDTEKIMTAATRVAGEDCSWFFRNGLTNEFLTAEKSIGTQIQDNISIMCSYDLSNVAATVDYDNDKQNNDLLKTIISSHKYVVLDEPFSIYRQMSSL